MTAFKKDGRDLYDIVCIKNHGHQGFIPFKDLTLEHLPIEDRSIETLDEIKNMGILVVRLVVDKIKNGRLIKESGSGCVVKFDNEYFIQTNNHFVGTEDELKHCTVEFHYKDDSRSDVLTSRGVELGLTCPYRDITNVKFHPVPDFLNQLNWIDLNQFHPNHSVLESLKTIEGGSDNLCCIGHPHAGIKMITFGRWLGVRLERFDNLDRHIIRPNQDCQCKEVSCLKYTCKTCPGSGGSPVFLLREVMGERIRLCHFMGEKAVETLPNGELVENINKAWFPTTHSQI